MAAMVVASSTAVGRSAGGPCCSSSTARLPQQQQAHVTCRKNVSPVMRMSVVLVGAQSRSRASSFPVLRNALAENPAPVRSPPSRIGSLNCPVYFVNCDPLGEVGHQ